jgi:hypothetical protein
MEVGRDNGQHRRYVGYKDHSTVVVVDRYVWRKNNPKTIEERVKERCVIKKSGNPF